MKSLTDVTPPTSEKQTDLCWHALHSEEVLSTLKTSLKSGLTSEKAAERLKQYGPNQLQEAARPTFLKVVIHQLNNFIVILLIVAAAISALLGDWIEASVILAIVILNAVLGVIQERRAEEALAALRKLAAPEALVLRDGHRIPLPAHVLVPGDIVFLEAGNYIPADVRLLEAVNLRVEEAALTGESVPVQKNAGIQLKEDIPLGDRKNTAFMGTLVSYGRGQGVVVSTGMHTQLGLIATMLQAVEQEETPLQRSLDQLGKFLGWGCWPSVWSFSWWPPPPSRGSKRNCGCLYDRRQPGHCSRSGRITGRGHHQLGPGHAGDDQTPCLDTPLIFRRDVGFRYGDLFR